MDREHTLKLVMNANYSDWEGPNVPDPYIIH